MKPLLVAAMVAVVLLVGGSTPIKAQSDEDRWIIDAFKSARVAGSMIMSVSFKNAVTSPGGTFTYFQTQAECKQQLGYWKQVMEHVDFQIHDSLSNLYHLSGSDFHCDLMPH